MKQELTLNLTLDQAKALIAIQVLMRDPYVEARFADQVMKRFQEQNCGRLINAWNGLVLQAQLRCKETLSREHAALIVRDIPIPRSGRRSSAAPAAGEHRATSLTPTPRSPSTSRSLA